MTDTTLERCKTAIHELVETYPTYSLAQMNDLLAGDIAKAVINELFNPGKGALDVEGKVTAIDGKNNIYICGEDLIKNGMWQAMLSACLDGK